MVKSDELTQTQIRDAVRDGVLDAGRSLLSTVFWTVLAAFTTLVGLQSMQLALSSSGIAAVGFAGVGLLVTGASVYLLYLLHW
ncbi:hypothetical protein [Halomicrococcus gelatinilyticus]|uniref:hypothetical protein n=1 Tax=Halomicrococcus gelatinilyticus TaxID=1702103 RepID=UPI002E0E96EC